MHKILSCDPKNEEMLYWGQKCNVPPQIQNAMGKVDKKTMIRNRYNQDSGFAKISENFFLRRNVSILSEPVKCFLFSIYD